MTSSTKSERGTKPQRIQRKRTKGWKMPPNTVYVGRPTVFGNPYHVQEIEDKAIPRPAELCVALFREIVRGGWDGMAVRKLIADSFIGCGCPDCDVAFDEKTEEMAELVYSARNTWLSRIAHHPTDTIRYQLRGKNLACFCELDQPCHADVLLEIANA